MVQDAMAPMANAPVNDVGASHIIPTGLRHHGSCSCPGTMPISNHQDGPNIIYLYMITVAELRSTENARCTITIRLVYEYATLYLLHAIPYVRMLRRVYEPKRVSPINYTIFPR